MRFTLEIDCDNAAFEDMDGPQLANIFATLAEREPWVGSDSGRLRDYNGNTVGKWELS